MQAWRGRDADLQPPLDGTLAGAGVEKNYRPKFCEGEAGGQRTLFNANFKPLKPQYCVLAGSGKRIFVAEPSPSRCRASRALSSLPTGSIGRDSHLTKKIDRRISRRVLCPRKIPRRETPRRTRIIPHIGGGSGIDQSGDKANGDGERRESPLHRGMLPRNTLLTR